MPEYSHCPVCEKEPWNGSDGAFGVCRSCQVENEALEGSKTVEESEIESGEDIIF